MPADYRRMYTCLAAAADAAITAIDQEESHAVIRLLLFSALQEAENIYIETGDATEEDR